VGAGIYRAGIAAGPAVAAPADAGYGRGVAGEDEVGHPADDVPDADCAVFAGGGEAGTAGGGEVEGLPGETGDVIAVA